MKPAMPRRRKSHNAVALFFVISGFLISNKTMNEQDLNGKISIEVLLRRPGPLGILPCLILMLMASYTLANPDAVAFHLDRQQLPHALLAVFEFRYNHWFMHRPTSIIWAAIWSLSIEEVFYLFAPCFMSVLPRRYLVFTLCALIIYGPIHRAQQFNSIDNYFSNFDLLANGVSYVSRFKKYV